jgi:hypothetical protein
MSEAPESTSALAERYRLYAAKCVRIAQDVPHEEKLLLLNMAQCWLALAEQTLKTNETIESVTRYGRPSHNLRCCAPERSAMRAVAEYRQNAEECRNLARLLTRPEDKAALEQMAQLWDRLADQREHDLIPEPDDA